MKTIKFLTSSALACLFAVGSIAQAEGEHSMTGCLAKAGDGVFSLTNVEGGTPATVAIAESAPDLSGHVGHKVEITGTTVAGADPTAHTMKVTAMKHVDAACP